MNLFKTPSRIMAEEFKKTEGDLKLEKDGNKTMRIIDLLNKIANGEEVPKKIKWGCHIYNWRIGEYVAEDELGKPLFSEQAGYTEYALNNEIKILEEENKIEKLEHYDLFDYFTGYKYGGTDKSLLRDLETNFVHINEELAYLINEISKLKEDK